MLEWSKNSRDVDATGYYSALMWAVSERHSDVAKLLVEHRSRWLSMLHHFPKAIQPWLDPTPNGSFCWYGSPVMNLGGRGRGKGKAPESASEQGQDAAKGTPAEGAGAAKGGFGGGNNPPNLAELSEKDVMNVIAMVRKEFNVDEKRMYMMGHSMGSISASRAGVWLSPVLDRRRPRSCPT